MRLVPGMTAAGTLAKLKAHLAKQGFGDIEVSMTGGYDPTDTPASSRLVEAMVRTYSKQGVGLLLWPCLAGSCPGRNVYQRAAQAAGRDLRYRSRRRRARAR